MRARHRPAFQFIIECFEPPSASLRPIVRGHKPVRFYGVLRVMLKSDQETVLRALEDARRIVGKCIAGQRDATRAVERLLAVLDEIEVVDALDRMTRRRILQLVDLTYLGPK
jgi:hypothetical protein